jgi:hypothetical protein
MTAATTPGIGYGSVVTWEGHDMGFMTDISGLNQQADKVDLSNNDSADAYKEYTQAFVDGGEVSITCRFIGGDSTGQKIFRDDLQARNVARSVVITRPDSTTTWTFLAIPIKMSDPIPVNGAMDVTFTMQITNKPAFANT